MKGGDGFSSLLAVAMYISNKFQSSHQSFDILSRKKNNKKKQQKKKKKTLKIQISNKKAVGQKSSGNSGSERNNKVPFRTGHFVMVQNLNLFMTAVLSSQ